MARIVLSMSSVSPKHRKPHLEGPNIPNLSEDPGFADKGFLIPKTTPGSGGRRENETSIANHLRWDCEGATPRPPPAHPAPRSTEYRWHGPLNRPALHAIRRSGDGRPYLQVWPEMIYAPDHASGTRKQTYKTLDDTIYGGLGRDGPPRLI
ncbi:hypothetical protein J6590_034059 [Homalodisca vitripennis]|nr:hypothetical protein J6590_034059 [Homalodisca vitripennis]